jgi:hypothetical protein
MSDTLKLIFSIAADGWLLVQAGFKVRAKKWSEFHSQKRFIMYVYDVLPVARTELPKYVQKTLDPEDTTWEDIETGNILVVKSKESGPKIQVFPK